MCGKASGADPLGEKYAREYNYKIHYFPANWDTYGKSSGFIRNVEMAKHSNAIITFRDENNSGTRHMIEPARNHDLKIVVRRY